ncbi:hypothetical protein MBLNU457_2102t1 [Dothideomycetes sp. NU457]
MEEDERPKKRQKRSAGDGLSNDAAAPKEEKKQGRPRAGPKDETAIDRRRTQIRLAQRAYRQRKESTIDELRNQVNELSAKANSMNKELREFLNKAVSRNVPGDLISSLEHLISRFETAEATAPRSNSASSSDQDRVMQTLNAVDTTVDVPQTSRQGLVETQLSGRTTPEPIHVGLGYSVMFDNNDSGPARATSSTSEDDSNASSVLIGHSTPASTPPDSFDATLGPPSSFKPKLLTSPHRAPHLHKHVFRFTKQLGRDNQECYRRFQICLLKGVHEDLDVDNGPYTHIGGAGTHFPFSRRAIKYITDEDKAAVKSFVARNPEFGGEWFDSGDVEGYLAAQGIHIDPRLSYVDVALPSTVLSLPPSEDMSGLTEADHVDTALEEYEDYLIRKKSTPKRTQSPNGTTVDAFDFDLTTMTDMLFPTVGYLDAQTGSFVNFNVGDISFPSSNPMRSTSGSPQNLSLSPQTTLSYQAPPVLANGPMPSMSPTYHGMNDHHMEPEAKIPVTIDVSKLVKLLTLNALCLGRGPGFRRADVDRALRASVLSVF